MPRPAPLTAATWVWADRGLSKMSTGFQDDLLKTRRGCGSELPRICR